MPLAGAGLKLKNTERTPRGVDFSFPWALLKGEEGKGRKENPQKVTPPFGMSLGKKDFPGTPLKRSESLQIYCKQNLNGLKPTGFEQELKAGGFVMGKENGILIHDVLCDETP